MNQHTNQQTIQEENKGHPLPDVQTLYYSVKGDCAVKVCEIKSVEGFFVLMNGRLTTAFMKEGHRLSFMKKNILPKYEDNKGGMLKLIFGVNRKHSKHEEGELVLMDYIGATISNYENINGVTINVMNGSICMKLWLEEEFEYVSKKCTVKYYSQKDGCEFYKKISSKKKPKEANIDPVKRDAAHIFKNMEGKTVTTQLKMRGETVNIQFKIEGDTFIEQYKVEGNATEDKSVDIQDKVEGNETEDKSVDIQDKVEGNATEQPKEKMLTSFKCIKAYLKTSNELSQVEIGYGMHQEIISNFPNPQYSNIVSNRFGDNLIVSSKEYNGRYFLIILKSGPIMTNMGELKNHLKKVMGGREPNIFYLSKKLKQSYVATNSTLKGQCKRICKNYNLHLDTYCNRMTVIKY